MNGDQALGIMKIGQERSDIAVADEEFGMRADVFEIKFLKQIVRAVAATRAENGAHLIAREHFF